MSHNPLKNLGSDEIIKFLIAHGCKKGKTQGDDTIFYYPGNYDIGININTNRRVKKSAYPKGTLLNGIKWLDKASKGRITKSTWIEWFSEKRNLKASKKK